MAGTPPVSLSPGPLERFKSIPSGGKGYEAGLQCGVCLGRFSGGHAGSLACGHTFCHLCLIKLLKVASSDSGQRACPLCRGPLDGLASTGLGSTLLQLKQHVKCLECGQKDVPNELGLFCNTCLKTLCKPCAEGKHEGKKGGEVSEDGEKKDNPQKCDVVPYSSETALRLYLEFLDWQKAQFAGETVEKSFEALSDLLSSDKFWTAVTPMIISSFRKVTTEAFTERQETIARNFTDWREWCESLSTTMHEMFRGVIPEEDETGRVRMRLVALAGRDGTLPLSETRELREKVEKALYRNIFPLASPEMFANTVQPSDPTHVYSDYLDVRGKRSDRLFHELGLAIQEKMSSEFRYFLKYHVLQSGFLSHVHDWDEPPPSPEADPDATTKEGEDGNEEMGKDGEEGNQGADQPSTSVTAIGANGAVEPMDTTSGELQPDNGELQANTPIDVTGQSENNAVVVDIEDQRNEQENPENEAPPDEATSISSPAHRNSESVSSDESRYDEGGGSVFESDHRSAVLLAVGGMCYHAAKNEVLLTASGQRLFACSPDSVEFGRCIQTAPLPWKGGHLTQLGQIAVSARWAFIVAPDEDALLLFSLGSWTLRAAVKLPGSLLPALRIHAGPSYVYVLSGRELARLAIQELAALGPCSGEEGPRAPPPGLVEKILSPVKAEFRDCCVVPSRKLLLVSEAHRIETDPDASSSSEGEDEYLDVFRTRDGTEGKSTYKIHFLDAATLALLSSEEDFFYRRSVQHRYRSVHDRLLLAVDAAGERLFLADFWDYSSEVRVYELGGEGGTRRFLGKVSDLSDRPAQLLPVGPRHLFVLESPDPRDRAERTLFSYALKPPRPDQGGLPPDSAAPPQEDESRPSTEFEPDSKPPAPAPTATTGDGDNNRLWE